LGLPVDRDRALHRVGHLVGHQIDGLWGRAMMLAGLSILALTAALMWAPKLDPDLVHLAWASLGLFWMLIGSIRQERRRR